MAKGAPASSVLDTLKNSHDVEVKKPSKKRRRPDSQDVVPGGAHVVGPGEQGLQGLESDLLADRPAIFEGSAEEDLTMAERLWALADEVEEEPPQAQQPKSESLAVLLEQALQSQDEALLDQCLTTADRQVIESTIEKLPAVRVLPLLLRLVGKFEKRPGRGPALALWIRAVLVQHTGYLMSIPDLSIQLARLHQMVEQRLSSFGKFLELSGRLDLLLAHVAQGKVKRKAVVQTTHNVYVEEEDEAEDGSHEEGSDASSEAEDSVDGLADGGAVSDPESSDDADSDA